jgi:hypothetical protein
MSSQMQITAIDISSTSLIERRVKILINKMFRTGYDPTWELYTNTLGWFESKEKMSAADIQIIKDIWEQQYEKDVQPLKDDEQKFETILTLNSMSNLIGQ